MVGDVVEQGMLFEQGGTLLETDGDDGTVDFGGFVNRRAGQRSAKLTRGPLVFMEVKSLRFTPPQGTTWAPSRQVESELAP